MTNYRAQFEDRGFVIVKGLFPDRHLRHFRSTIEELVTAWLRKHGLSADGDPCHEGAKRLFAAHPASSHHIYNIIRNSNALGALINCDELAEVVKSVLGIEESQTYYTTYQVCRIDPPNDTHFVLPWHQEAWDTFPNVPNLQLWAPAVSPNNRENGSIDVLEGSHRMGEVPHYLMQTPRKHLYCHVRDGDIPTDAGFTRTTIEIEPGDVLLFHVHLLHRSNTNPSPRVRYSLTANFVNPHHEGFVLDDLAEVIQRHRKRTVNAHEFMHLIEGREKTGQPI